ncbi:MAG: hypothetical protein AAGB10_17580 [Pseudomonadota bacterium]
MKLHAPSQRDMPFTSLLGDAIGLAAICVMVLVGLTVPSVF